MATNNQWYDPNNGWKYKPPKHDDDTAGVLLLAWLGIVVFAILINL